MLKTQLLRRFLPWNKKSGRPRPAHVFLDRVPEKVRHIYGEHALVACSGWAMFIVPENKYDPSLLDNFSRADWACDEQMAPKWQKIMASLEPKPAMVPMRYAGRPVVLRGRSAEVPSVGLFAPTWNSHPSKWAAFNTLLIDMTNAVGAKICLPVAHPKFTRQDGSPIPVYPVMGRAGLDGPPVVLGAVMEYQLDAVKMPQEELFCRVVADYTGKELEDAAVDAKAS